MTCIDYIACILEKCQNKRNLVQILRLHAYMHRVGLVAHCALGNLLVPVLVAHGSIHHAQQVFDNLNYPNGCSWNSLIVGHLKLGDVESAFNVYQKMQEDASSCPLGHSFVALIKACTADKDMEKGCKLHRDAARAGLLESNVFIGSALVHMYVSCGLLARAEDVFYEITARDVVLWNALIAGYAEHGLGEEAIACFEQMRHEGMAPDVTTLVSTLTACSSISAILSGQELHNEIILKGFEREPLVGNTLVDVYVKCGFVDVAEEVLHKLGDRDVVSWTALISGYVEAEYEEDALKCFQLMQAEEISPNSWTLVCILKACAKIGHMGVIQELHSQIIRKGLDMELLVGYTLLDSYAKCGSIITARQVFNQLPVHGLLAWTALISGYVDHGYGMEALKCVEHMQEGGISGDLVTLLCSLKACGAVRSIWKGREIHIELTKKGLEREVLAGNALVDLYGKCDLLVEAHIVFEKLPTWGVVTWAALISNYVEHGCAEEALHYFEEMQQEHILADAVVFVCGLKACSGMGACMKGQRLHEEVTRRGMEGEVSVGNIIVDMYAKFGLLEEARAVFDRLVEQDLVAWNALVTGYAQVGDDGPVSSIYRRMLEEGVKPDSVTHTGVLNVCCHAGLVDEGKRAFKALFVDDGVILSLDHHARMVDLHARAGLLNMAVALVDRMPLHPDSAIWLTVLGACKKWGNVVVGRYAFDNALEKNANDTMAYVSMSNIYAIY